MTAYTAAQRREMAAKGEALPDGSYPIKNRADLENAIHAVGRGSAPHADIVTHIKKRAAKLNAEAMLPATWSIEELHDLADFFGLDLLDNDQRLEAYRAWNAYAERMQREDGLEQIGTWGANLHGIGLAKPGAAKLAEYWTHGEGAAKIAWGTKGAMHRCIAELGKYVHKSPGGLCADYHKIATGEWPTEHGKAGIPS